MEFESVSEIERATRRGRTEMFRLGTALLFVMPLICAVALLSFAHGANDVANAVGPLAAINDAILQGAISSKATIPLWVMMFGAIGIAIGLALYGPKLIRTVGTEITELDQMRVFCVALSAAITVIIATHFGLPVSSTHVAVGGVFGVGFLREYLKTTYTKMVIDIQHHYHGEEEHKVEEFLKEFKIASIDEKGTQAPARRLSPRTRKTFTPDEDRGCLVSHSASVGNDGRTLVLHNSRHDASVAPVHVT